jgi:DNA-directed RNA polymerase sigma subunit (sigma70/sigma32)
MKSCAHTHPQQTTWQEIADHLGVSRMRVFQIHKGAIQKLRARLLNDPVVREKLRMEAKK